MRYLAPDDSRLDKFIEETDDILFPLKLEPERYAYAVRWLGQRQNRDLLRQIICYRQTIAQEANANVVTIALKWTCREHSVETLTPGHILMGDLNKAVRWSVIVPDGQTRPLAEYSTRLSNFMANSVPSLTRHVDSGHNQRQGPTPKLATKEQLSAKTRLIILDKLFFSTLCLSDRFYETVLPARLVDTEISLRAQSSGVGALLERSSDSPEYVDQTKYFKTRILKTVRLHLETYLLRHLADHRELGNTRPKRSGSVRETTCCPCDMSMLFQKLPRPIYGISGESRAPQPVQSSKTVRER
jgi:hypothetical protein